MTSNILSPFQKFVSLFFEKKDNLDKFQREIGYRFRNKKLLLRSLTHRSSLTKGKQRFSYERLEYLGDAVVQLVVSYHLFEQFPESEEGTLTQFRSRIVNRKHLANITRKYGFHKYLISTPQKEKESNGVLSDLFESITGAIFIDGGLRTAERFIDKFLFSDKDSAAAISTDENYKGMLVEYCQKNNLPLPNFKVVSDNGVTHDQRFFITVYIGKKKFGGGQGYSKKEAGQRAAENVLKMISGKLQI